MTSNRKRLVVALGVIILIATMIIVTRRQETSLPADDIAVAINVIYAGEDETESRAATAAALGPCVDSAFALAAWRIRGDWPWYYNQAGTPGSIAGGALSTIHRGTWTMFTGNNHCGIPVAVPFRERYQGLTAATAQVSASGGCMGNDGRSVISWGNLPASILAFTCTYYKLSTGLMVASDTLLSVRPSWFVGNMPPNCSGRFDLESVIVHESGHVIGLAHVVQSGHSSLVMYPRTLACTTQHRWLALGDVNGRRAIVG